MMYPACLPTSFLIMSFQTGRPWSARLHAVEVRHIDFDLRRDLLGAWAEHKLPEPVPTIVDYPWVYADFE